MKQFYLALIHISFISISLGVTAQELPKASEPTIWLRADKGTKTPGLWADQSENKFNATAAAGQAPETGEWLNFNPVLDFDGVDDYLEVPYSLEKLSGFTLVTVFSAADSLEYGIWGVENGPERKALLTTRHVQGPDSTMSVYRNNEKRAVLSAVTQNWSDDTEEISAAFLALGSAGKHRDPKPFKGAIAEFMLFDEPLTFLERTKVQTYLAIKYGIALTEGNYVSSSEKVLWHTENNSGYAHNITGLGRDDAFSLYQKQAQSAYDTAGLLVMSVGEKAVSNAENNSRVNDGDFLVWGDNGLSFEAKSIEGEDTLLSVIERKWLMKATGYTAKTMYTELRFDISVLPNDSLGYWLAIDRTGSGDFTIDNLHFIEPDTVTQDSIAIFKNVQWDTDGSGGDMFGFARKVYMLPVLTEINHPGCFEKSGGSIKIQVLGGRPDYRYELMHNTATDLHREWYGADSARQKKLTSGTYTLKVEDADGYEVERTFELAIPNALIVDLGEDQRLRKGEEITLDASVHIPDSIPVSYYWEGNYGFRSTDSLITVTESGIYTATVTKKEDECPFGDQIVISGSPVKKFEVLPNVMRPGRVKINLSLKEPGEVAVRIVDANGGVYRQMKAGGRAEYQFIEEIRDSGMYLVVVESDGTVDTRKLIVY